MKKNRSPKAVRSAHRILVSILILLLGVAILAACASTSPATPTPTPSASVSSAPAAPGQTVFIVDTSQSEASYTVHEQFFERALSKLGIKPGKTIVTGTTRLVEGEIHVNLDDLSQPPMGTIIKVNLTGLKTDQSRRDKWIQEKGPNFLKYPIATFVAKAIRNAPAAYQEGQEMTFQLEGDLTIRDITRPVTFDVAAKIEKGVLTGTARTQIKMTDFGIDPPNFAQTLSVGNDVIITVHIVARQK